MTDTQTQDLRALVLGPYNAEYDDDRPFRPPLWERCPALRVGIHWSETYSKWYQGDAARSFPAFTPDPVPDEHAAALIGWRCVEWLWSYDKGDEIMYAEQDEKRNIPLVVAACHRVLDAQEQPDGR